MKRGELYRQLINMDAVELYKLLLRGDIKILPKGFWQQPEALQNAHKIMNYLFKEKLKWTEEDVKEKFDVRTISESKLNSIMTRTDINSLHDLVVMVYPKIKPWEVKVPRGFWKDKNNISAYMNWLIKDQLKWSETDAKQKFDSYVLGNRRSFGDMTIYELIALVYPNIKPWELTAVSRGFWEDENNIREYMNWLFKDNLKWSEKDVKEKFDTEYLINNISFIRNKRTIYELVVMVYPKIKPWEMKHTSDGFWDNLENKKAAMTWLFVEKMGCVDYDDANNKFDRSMLKTYKLTVFDKYKKEDILKMICFESK